MNHAIRVEGLRKSYGSNAVLKGLSFQVTKGEIFALLGVNGAGKTTALECIEGLRRYDSGSIHVHGKLGVQLQSASLPEAIRAMEAVRLFAKWNKARADEATLKALGIDEIGKKQYGQMSTGQKRRLHLGLALIGDPDIVVLDEPTAGLDVEGRVALHEEIRKLRARGKTIVLASHDMAEVESLCDRIAILKDGGIVFAGTAEALTAKIGSRRRVRIQTARGEECFESTNVSETLLTELARYQEMGVAVEDISIEKGTLEEHFINIARGNDA